MTERAVHSTEHENSGHHLKKDGAVLSSDLHKNGRAGEADTPDSWSIPIRRNQPRRTEDDGNLVFEGNLLTVFWLCTNVRVQSRYRIPNLAE